ncbi:MAG: DUF485 domain-containing protein [Pseudomonadota bacterium]
MTHRDMIESIRRHPDFQPLVARRARYSWSLLALILAAYSTLAILVAFRPALLRTPVAAGGMTNVGIVAGVAVIALGWLLTWAYVRRANGEFDAINRRILDEVLP